MMLATTSSSFSRISSTVAGIREVEAIVETMEAEHTTRWRHTSSSHAAIIGTLTTQKAESAVRRTHG